jgi:hypothetical protein
MPGREHWMARMKPLGPRAQVAYRRTLSPAEVAALRAGLWPRDMDDRWIVYLGEDGLAMHRSWSGHCIYSVPASATSEGGLVLGPLFVSDDAASYRRQDDTKEIEMVDYLIDDTVNRIQKV